MFAFLAPAALKLFFGNMLGGAASGVKAAGKWLGSLDLVHALLLVVALFGAWQTVGRWAQHRHTVKVEAQLSASAAQLAASRANEAALTKAIADQNAAIAAMSAETAKQQAASAKASQIAQERSNKAQATATRLTASSRAGGPRCEPSAALKGAWQ